MKKLFVLIMALLLAALPLTSLAATKTTTTQIRYVFTGNSGRLNVRSSPKAPANNLITRLENGTKVEVVGYHDGQSWAVIQFKLNGKTTSGYVQTRYLSSTKPVIVTKTVEQKIAFNKFKHVEPYTAIVTPSTPGGVVNMRWAPSKSNDVMAKLYANTQVTIIATNGTWAQIYDPNTGYVGFMMQSFLK